MKKILIVDDTKNIRLMLSKYFETEQCDVICAENGKQALELLLSQQFDLVLLDIKMPEMSGTEVLRRIREQGIQTPVMIMTAYGTIKNAVETTNLGAVAYLQKPFTVDKMNKLLNELNLPQSDADMDLLQQAEQWIQDGQTERAIARLKELLSKDSLNERIYGLLSLAYEQIGDLDISQKYRRLAEALQV
jgi:two-component system OmpR family response regulator